MSTIIILTGLFVMSILFYKISVIHSNKFFLILHFISFMIFACILYPMLAKKSGLFILSTFLFFLPIISTLRLYEISKQKTKEQKMREFN